MHLADLPLYVSTRPSFVGMVERFARHFALSQGRSGRREVALTFDDGPHPRFTPQVLDALDAIGAKGTFFVVGRAVKEHGAVVKETRRRGHEIGTHLYTHDRRTVYDDRKFAAELAQSKSELEALLGERIRWLRFPYGERGTQEPRALEAQYGVRAAHWTYSTHDGKLRDPARIVARFRAGLRAGAIVLLHDALNDETTLPLEYSSDRGPMLAALPDIGRAIGERALRAVTLSDFFAP